MAPMGRYIIEAQAFNEIWVKVSERSLLLDACTVAEIYSYDNPVRLYRIRGRHAITFESVCYYFKRGHQVFLCL